MFIVVFACSVGFLRLQTRIESEAFPTLLTNEWFLPSVHPLMAFLMANPDECFLTIAAAKWPFPSVDALVFFLIATLNKCFLTKAAAKWLFSSMDFLMPYHIVLSITGVIAYSTNKPFILLPISGCS